MTISFNFITFFIDPDLIESWSAAYIDAVCDSKRWSFQKKTGATLPSDFNCHLSLAVDLTGWSQNARLPQQDEAISFEAFASRHFRKE